MLKTRIIPTLLWKDYGLVKGVGFDSWRRIGSVLPAIKVYNLRQVDELIVVDIGATTEGREPDYGEIENFSKECFVPLSVGGGISSVEHVRKILIAGADKVCINSVVYKKPELIREISKKFGSQCLIVSIDVARRGDSYKCFSLNGQKEEDIGPVELAKKVEKLGAGEILITSIKKDGTMSGYDLKLIKEISAAVSIPVIASGGAKDYEDMFKAIKAGASAVAVASIFHFTEQTPLEAKEFLKLKGVPVRK